MLFVCTRDVPPLRPFEASETLLFTQDGRTIGSVQYLPKVFQQEFDSTDPPPEEFELPSDQLDWPLAISALQTWLRPLRLPEYVGFAGTTLPFFVEPESFFPLYFLAGQLKFENLQRALEISLYTFSFPIVRRLFLEENRMRRLLKCPELHLAMIQLFKILCGPDDWKELKALEFTEVICELGVEPSGWLLSVYNQFWESDSRDVYGGEIRMLWEHLQVEDNPERAFVFWLYAPFFGLPDADARFAPFARDVKFDGLFHLSEHQIAWLASRLPLDSVFPLFSFNASHLSNAELLNLLPLLEKHTESRALIVSRFRDPEEFEAAIAQLPGLFKDAASS